MEVPVAPDGVYSGFPTFGAPSEVVGALARSGWDGCATASNHSADRGEEGVVATLDALDSHGLGHAGTYRSREDASVPFALYELEREGRTVTVAQISTTMGLNGLDDPTGYSVSLNDVGAITKAAKTARAAGADLVVVHSQIGQEYETKPNDEQVSYAQSLADSGQVDILFGAHPMCLSPPRSSPERATARGCGCRTRPATTSPARTSRTADRCPTSASWSGPTLPPTPTAR